MTRQLKRYYLSKFLKISGFPLVLLSFPLSFIFGLTIDDNELSGILVFVSMLFLFIGLLELICLTFVDDRYAKKIRISIPLVRRYGYEGVPNNPKKEFDFPINNLSPLLILKEKEKKKYEIIIDDKKYMFDMQGWTKAEKHIKNYILMKIQIKYSKDRKIYKSIYVPIKELKLSFQKRNGKIKFFTLINNNQTIVDLSLSQKTKSKVALIRTSKISIDLLYDFN